MSYQATSDTRLDVRIPRRIKETIERAASLTGNTLSSYAINTLQASAEKDIQEYETVLLNERERDRFLDILANPPKPNEALRSLMKG